MGENGVDTANMNGSSNGHHKSSHRDKERRKETEEERKIRKDKERKEREERHKREGRREETEEERRIRKEKEKARGKETEEERKIRKEKERKERDERHKKEGRREETEEERKIRKEKEREERHKKEGRSKETEEERRIRKEKERKERDDRHKHKEKETEEQRRERKDRERAERKEKERRERKEREAAEAKVKQEQEEEQNIKQEEEEESQSQEDETSQNGVSENGHEEEMEEEVKEEVKEEPMEEDFEEEKPSRSSKKRKYEEVDEEEEEFKQEEPEEEEEVKEEALSEFEEDEGSEDDYAKPRKAKKLSKKEKEKAKKEAEKKRLKEAAAKKAKGRQPPTTTGSPAKKKVKKEDEQEVWKWWEETENKKNDGTKWHFLEHKGPVFAPDYEPLPTSVRFYYDGKKMRLSQDAEEVATFYGRMIEHDYTEKEAFNKNFFKDWRKCMNEEERSIIKDLSKCDFREINTHFKKCSEERKARSKEEKKAEKERNEEIQKEYGFCNIDGHNEKIGNFRIEPPGLFRGRGEHPKMGVLKKRVMPEEVIINCSKDSKWPEPPPGHKWKKVQHDDQVTWLASWTENVQNQIKYVMLNPSSKLKGEKDMMKYEKARMLKKQVHKIREDYTADFKSKEMRVRQRAVALYFIDKLALRAGNEKDEDQADTVGCCSLRVEHITLHPEKDGKENVVEFDFLGKDSIRYNNAVPVEKRVYKNVSLFMENKKQGDDLFDRLNTSVLNEYLNSLMQGLTAKVFRTYNASITLQEQLAEMTDETDNVPAKMLSYNRANRAVAILCNHQRAVPKTFDKSMENLQKKIDDKKEAINKAEKEFKSAKKAYKNGGSAAEKANLDKKKKALERGMEQLNKLETQAVDKEENKTIALGTSKLNYLDPRISVAWCKKFDVPVEKVYNKTQREKFRWAIDMAGPDYEF